MIIYHPIPQTGGPPVEAALRVNSSGGEPDEADIRLAPSLERPWRAFVVLRDPVERVCALYDSLDEAERGDMSLAAIYRELGGGGPRSSAAHDRLAGFFNGQARAILAPWRDHSKLEYWAGCPEPGFLLRDRAMELLDRHYVVGVQERLGRSLERFAAAFGWRLPDPLPQGGVAQDDRLDPETRSLVLAHNQLDAELHAHFSAALERQRSLPRGQAARTPQRRGGVCILGSPRSGTSLTARVLNVLGLDLGPEAGLMRPAAANNRTGFWEHEDIANLNEEIFAALSDPPPPFLQGWRFPPALGQGWQRDQRLDRCRQAARSILRRDFAHSSLWGWKDPRTCLTLPFWQELVAEMRYVICVRHPLDVAASLQARDGMLVEDSLRLWLRYMSEALDGTGGAPRVFVAYESFFDDREEAVGRLAELLGVPQPSEAQRVAIAKHLDESMWHHRRGGRDTEAEESLPPAVAELYAALVAEA